MYWERLTNIISLLENNREDLLQYFYTKNFDYTNFDNQDNNHISDKVFYYDYRLPQTELDHPVISKICSYDYISYCSLTKFPANLHIKEHLDPRPSDQIYQETQSHYFFEGESEYRRIHFPLQDSGLNCYMIYDNQKITWKKGNCEVFDVANYPHEFFNETETSFALFLVDVILGEGRITTPYQ